MNKISVSLNNIKLTFQPDNNHYDITLLGFILENCSVKIRIDGVECSDFSWTERESNDASLILDSQNEYGSWKLTFTGHTEESSAESLSITLSGQLNCKVRKLELIPLAMPCLVADHMLVHGRKMGGCDLITLPVKDTKEINSIFQCMITSKKSTLQISHSLKQKHLSSIFAEIEGNEIQNLEVMSPVEFCEEIFVETDTVTLQSGNGHNLMVDWGEQNRLPDKKFIEQQSGWNSWDYYRWTVTEDEVLANADFIASDPVLSKYIKKIIVDDGWQYCYGEWDANPLFPSGMKSLVSNLNQMGFEAGLWLAPTIIEPHCRIAQWDTDMLAMSESGLPCLAYSCMKRVGFVLDPTREKVQQWLHDLFTRYADMGYSYFKLDFLGSTFSAPRFHEANVNKGTIMRRILEPIRAATKGKADLLGCNFHFEGGTDMVDAIRASGDIHPMWKSVCSNTIPIACRFWSHKRLWLNDPDFAVIRGRDTADNHDLNRLKPLLVYNRPEETDPGELNNGLSDISYDEAQTLLSIVIISDGVRNLSDKLPLLNEQGLDLLRRTVAAPYGEAGIPLDLFSTDKPAHWLQKTSDGYRVLLINWGEEEQKLSLDLKPHGINTSTATNFWTDEPVEIKNGISHAELKPHTCLLAIL